MGEALVAPGGVVRLVAFLDGAGLDYLSFDGVVRRAVWERQAGRLVIDPGATVIAPISESSAVLFWLTNADRTPPAGGSAQPQAAGAALAAGARADADGAVIMEAGNAAWRAALAPRAVAPQALPDLFGGL